MILVLLMRESTTDCMRAGVVLPAIFITKKRGITVWDASFGIIV